jgi:hypothetical protein
MERERLTQRRSARFCLALLLGMIGPLIFLEQILGEVYVVVEKVGNYIH